MNYSKILWRYVFLFFLFALVSACQRTEQPAQSLESTREPTTIPTPIPATQTPSPTPEVVTETASVEAAALVYYQAWTAQDYGQMYAALSPDSQTRIDSPTFVAFYEEAMTAAAVEGIETELLATARNGDQADLRFRVTWQTAVAGDIIREHQVGYFCISPQKGIFQHYPVECLTS